MHALAVGRMQHDAPVPALVAAALDDQGAVGGQCARGLALLRGELEDVGDGVGVQARSLQRGMGVAGRGIHLAQECAYGLAQFRGAPQPLAAPERKPRGPAGRGNDDHLVVRDLLDAPGGRAQGDDVVHPGFVDHLLVQLAHAARARLFLALGQHDGEHAAVGNGAAADDGQALRARACAELPADPVPDEARAELGELVGRVAPGQHVQRGIERAARQRGGTDRPCARGRTSRPRAWRPWRRPPRSAAPARRAGCGAARWLRALPPACGARSRRHRPARAACADRPGRGTSRPPGAPHAPRAAGRSRPRAARPPGSPGPPGPCLCPAPGWRWPPRTAAPRT